MSRLKVEVEMRTSDKEWSRKVASEVEKKFSHRQKKKRFQMAGVIMAFLALSALGDFVDLYEIEDADDYVIYLWDSLEDDEFASIIY
jgi:hypothetical protein